ncbi:MFS transporter [Peribacillus sp. SCS-37]|uniref:MFS transporter n=1 Tax=Paraperibacillus esterisolvens TaxID=3115296 RepID=UPI003905E14F
MGRRHRVNAFILFSVVFGGFLIFGLSENVKGPALPKMQADFSLNESQLGILLALNSLGFLLACSFTSRIADRVGIKWTGIIAFITMAAAGVAMFFSKGFLALAASYFLLYAGNGVLEIGLGIMAARIFIRNTGTMMNIAHFFYGLSSIGAPVIGASMMGWAYSGEEFGWRGMYLAVLLLSLLPVIPALFGKFPEQDMEEGEKASVSSLVRDPVAWLIVAVLTCGTVSEMGISSWLVYYLENSYGWSLKDASGMLSLFFLFFTITRLLAGPVIDRIGFSLSIMIFSAFSGVCSLAGILAGEGGAILFALAGIGIAPIYPTVMALLAKRYVKGIGNAITFTVTLLGVASVLGNLAIGFIIDWVGRFAGEAAGLQAGYGFVAILSLMCAGFCFIMHQKLKAVPKEISC